MAAYFMITCFFFLFSVIVHVSCTGNPPFLSFDQGFNPLYGEINVIPYEGNKSVQISMDEITSSGFRSKLMYMYGYFESSIKLPENYSTAGVVVTFYTGNNQKYPYRHDEIDFEFLGHIQGQQWTVQTNFYGNGSTNRGREERYVLWFDPSKDFHRYGILWSDVRITYYVDDIPIRDVKRVDGMKGDFPSKEMSVYGTVWNGSNWATNGGKQKLDLSYGPYVAKYSSFVLNGCPFDTMGRCNGNLGSVQLLKEMNKEKTTQMLEFRRKYMTYSHCYDKNRYVIPLPECVMDFKELAHLQKLDPWTFGGGGN